MKKFEELKRLYRTINGYSDPYDFSDEMLSGLTADFDRLFELSWKVLKEYLRYDLMMNAARTGSPKEIIKLAYAERLIDDESLWLTILKDRNDDILKMGGLIPEEELPDERIPDSFFEAYRDSHLSLVDFISKTKAEKGLRTDEEAFNYWEKDG